MRGFIKAAGCTCTVDYWVTEGTKYNFVRSTTYMQHFTAVHIDVKVKCTLYSTMFGKSFRFSSARFRVDVTLKIVT